MIDRDKELRQKLKQWRAYDWEAERFLGVLESLLAGGCSGVMEKLEDESPKIDHDPKKFRNLWSEFKIAEVLMRAGHKVALLGEHKPDIETFRDGRRTFVEVARKSADDGLSRIYDPNGLTSRVLANLPVRIRFHEASDMGVPAISYVQRLEREERVRRLEEWLVDQLKSLDLDALPVTLKGDGVEVTVERHSEIPGYFRGGTSDVFWVPEDEARANLRREVRNKNTKHLQVRESDPDACYVVALDIEVPFFQSFLVLSALYGPLIHLSDEHRSCRSVPSSYESKLLDARRIGWGEGLDALELEIGTPPTWPESIGLFLEDELCGVDGVLALYYTNAIQLAPNFFSGNQKTLGMRDWFPFPEALEGIAPGEGVPHP